MESNSPNSERAECIYRQIWQMTNGTTLERSIAFDLAGILGTECSSLRLEERLDIVEQRLTAFHAKDKQFLRGALLDLLEMLSAARKSIIDDEDRDHVDDLYAELLASFRLSKEEVDGLLDRLDSIQNWLERKTMANQWLDELGV